ncbi:hypothetical protein [Azoarcus sp. DD4]|uniref:hypothetical protein n=1 Tax=Azoarcus sp. DD4 TaxID=2027405 RepID=UPI00112A9698|nr:hypothetical protein [Azoarcus sp. DD4]
MKREQVGRPPLGTALFAVVLLFMHVHTNRSMQIHPQIAAHPEIREKRIVRCRIAQNMGVNSPKRCVYPSDLAGFCCNAKLPADFTAIGLRIESRNARDTPFVAKATAVSPRTR